jgi:hypothetical protein
MSLEYRHRPQGIAIRQSAGPSTGFLKNMIYGGIDGAVTTFAIVAGVASSVPLLPFLLALPSAVEVSVLATMIASFLIGTGKSRWSLSSWWRSLRHERTRKIAGTDQCSHLHGRFRTVRRPR